MTPPAPALKSQFAWTFAGNAVNAASQWAVLSLLAKLGSAEMLGQYALALAIAGPPAMLAHLNLRAVVATDIQESHTFGEYLSVRVLASTAGFFAIAGIAATAEGVVQGATTLIAISYALEAISDLHFGWMQRRDRMDLVARSMMLRGGSTLLFVGALVAISPGVLTAAAALVLARGLALFLYDMPRSGAPRELRRPDRQIWAAAAPLGVVLALSSLNVNVPRYAVEYYLGVRELGIFAAVASFVTVGSTMVNAMGQSATTRLARAFANQEHRGFKVLVAKLVLFTAALGVAGTIVAAVAGGFFLRLLYRPEFSTYQSTLVWVMLAATGFYAATMIGYVNTSTRQFAAQVPLLLFAVLAGALTSFLAVPRLGLEGGALALGVAGCCHFLGGLYVLSRAL